MNKVIRSQADYQNALAAIEDLIDRDPAPGTADSDDLELLTLLIQNYEDQQYQLAHSDPIDALKFRMEQQDLTPRDLIPYLGSRSKVSEVLARKRPLTLSMIRALHTNLGIPAKVLIQEELQASELSIDWGRFPIKQMSDWGWITIPNGSESASPRDILQPFFAAAGSFQLNAVLCRTSRYVRSVRAMDEYSLAAWSVRILAKAKENPVATRYKPETLNLDFLQKVVRLSPSDNGPLLAKDFLGEYGIQLVVERHLPKTYLDGAAFMIHESNPVIGLTLRYDRIDNFWFSLMHELAHLALHSQSESNVFYDDLDMETGDDPRESEADNLAGEALIPYEDWEKSPASRLRSPEAAEHLANKLQIHPAIVAGRMRHEFKAFRLLNNLVGHRKVRKLFPETKWR